MILRKRRGMRPEAIHVHLERGMGRHKQPLSHTTLIPVDSISDEIKGPPISEEAVERLSHTIGRQGLRHPIVVIPRGEDGADVGACGGADSGAGGAGNEAGYQLLVGRRRLLAVRHLGWKEMTCILLSPEFKREAAVIAALQGGSTASNGDGISPWALADMLHSLKGRFGWTQHQLGKVVGKSRDFVTGYLALSNVLPEVRQYLLGDPKGAALSSRHLRFLGRTAPRLQMKVAREIVAEGLSTKELELRKKRRSKKRVLFKVRVPPPAHAASTADSRKEWRKVLRQLGTELRRLERSEKSKRQRAEKAIRSAQLELRQIKSEAKEKRALLKKELHRTKRRVERIGL